MNGRAEKEKESEWEGAKEECVERCKIKGSGKPEKRMCGKAQKNEWEGAKEK